MGARRIFLNVAATYGRSLIALICGLFTGRWALAALGERDFGLWVLISGLGAFVVFLNGLMGLSVSRFYAYAIGERSLRNSQRLGLEDVRRWFCAALVTHCVLACILVAIGYPVGRYLISHWLEIPAERVGDCVKAFGFVCLSCWTGMVSVPFSAMYSARQNIAEFSLYGFAQTAVHFFLLWYAVYNPQDWFIPYVAWISLMTLAVNVISSFVAVWKFPECRLPAHATDIGERIHRLGAYALWQFFGGFGSLARTQGLNVLVNRMFGSAMNASYGVSQHVQSQAQGLSAAFIDALTPVVTTVCGAGAKDAFIRNSMRVSRIGGVLAMMLTIPLVLEMGDVLRLWLVTPPPQSQCICFCVLVSLLIDRMTSGQKLALNAYGRIAAYQISVGCILAATLPFAWFLARIGMGFRAVGYALVAGSVLAGLGRVFFARRVLGFGIADWLRNVMLPVMSLGALAIVIGLMPRLVIPVGLCQLAATMLLSGLTVAVCAWWIVFDDDERRGACNVLMRVFARNADPKVRPE